MKKEEKNNLDTIDGKTVESVLEKIEKENIKPKSKEYFIVKNWFFISLSLLSFFLACAGTILNILFLSRLDFDIVITFPMFQIVRIVYPTVFWLSIAIGLGIVTYIFFKNTQKGYQVERKYMYIGIPLLVALLVVFGFLLENRVNLTSNWVSNPILRDISDPRYQLWNSSEEGRLAGTIDEVKNEEIIVTDIEDKEWNVDVSESFVAKRVELEEGGQVKIVGTKTSENTFKAERIMPWGQGKMGRMQENGYQGRSNR